MNKEQFSYSKINSYNTCPRKYEFSYVDFYPRKENNTNIIKGTLLHKMIELYINDQDYNIAYEGEFLLLKEEEFNAFKQEFESIKEQTLIKQLKKMKENCEELNVEQKLSNIFNDFAFSGFSDTLVKNKDKVIIIDYKTGKVYPNFEQLEFYALIASYIYKEVNEFLLILSFTSHTTDYKLTIKRDELYKIENKLLKYISNIKNSIKFQKKIGPLCNYCEYKPECEAKDKLDKIVEDVLYSKKFLPSSAKGPLIYNGYIGSNTIVLNEEITLDDIKKQRILSGDNGTFLLNILQEYKIKLNHLFMLNYNFYVDNEGNQLEGVLEDFNREQFNQIFKLINPSNIIIFGEELYKKFTKKEDFAHNSVKIHNGMNIYMFDNFEKILNNFEEEVNLDILNELNQI